MPTYEYMCTNCGHSWEKEQKITEEAHRECSSCGQQTAKRLVSGGQGFQLLNGGVGWYKNGYSGEK